MNKIIEFKFFTILLTLVSLLLLTGCNNSYESNDNIERVSYKQPPFYSQLTATITSASSSQRISPLAASRIQAYSYLAAYLAYKNAPEGFEDSSAIKAASAVAKELYFNVPVVTGTFNMLEDRYKLVNNNDAVTDAVERVLTIAKKDRYSSLSNNVRLPKIPDKFRWIPTGIEQRVFMDSNYGDIRTIAYVRNDCDLPDVNYDLAIKEVKELFDNFDIAKSNNLYVTTFLAGVGTPTPPGQNLLIVTNAVINNKKPILEGLKIITSAALAIFDTGILTWYEKREHYLARPETLYYNITNKRVTLLRDTPAHPSYPSGHSAFSGANAAVIEEFIGEDTKLNLTLPDDVIAKETSFEFLNAKDFASKVNQSRVDAGFHYPMDVKAGEMLGRCVGKYYSKNFDLVINKILENNT
jgi:hypothetical protein